MLRVYKRAIWYRPPRDDDGELPLRDGENRFNVPLRADGTDEDPDEFDLRDRIDGEFGVNGETPQEAGKRAKKVEELLAAQNDKVERVEPDD